MIRDILGKATKGAITWLGNTLGLPSGITKGASDIAGSLFTKQTGGGEFQVIDTSLKSMPRFGGRLGYSASRMAGGAKGYAETVNPETLYAAWDRRLSKYYSDKYKVARTVKGKVV
tara:strand:- start:189 stop:536 length:348 start_codon:yes stop_codon:yes gene_type:complete